MIVRRRLPHPAASLLAALLCASAVGGCLARPASAGTYDVYACGGAAGGWQNAFVPLADPLMSAYWICPPQSSVGTGIVTKSTSSGGIAGYTHGAYQIFEAPPGASLVSVDFNVGAIRLANHWSVGLVAYDGDFNQVELSYGCFANMPGCGVGTPSFSIPVHVDLRGHTKFRFETRCMNPVGCDVRASGFTPANKALFSAANVSVRVHDGTAPSIAPRSGALWGDGWHRGFEQAWSGYFDNVGVMLLRLYVDGVLRDEHDFRRHVWPDHMRCDFTQRRPCDDIDPGGLSLDTRGLADGEHTMRVEVMDAAGNVSGVNRALRVDNTPPAQVSGLRLEGEHGWRSTNAFSIAWKSSADAGAPIVAARYTLCPAAPGGPCVEGKRAGQGITSLDGLTVPGPGDYRLRVWLEDGAGNHDPDRAAPPLALRFDDEAPTAWFEPTRADDPTRVSVRVGDRGAGVDAAIVELRRAGADTWRTLASSLIGDHVAAAVDDAALPDGLYELRAYVRDGAGNERVVYRRADGSRMELRLPLRQGSRVTLSTRVPKARARRCAGSARRKRSACRRRAPSVRTRDGRARVRGRVKDAAGHPIAGGALTVAERLRGRADLHRVAAVRTDAAGRFEYLVERGPSRSLHFRYQGSALVKPSSNDLNVLVPARSSIGVDRHSLRNGDEVRFSGALRLGPIPDGGKLIDLQAYYRRRWRTFATPRTDARGNWSYRYRFEATRGVVVYRFRARIRREAAYPYELGHSRVVRVTVRG